MLSMSLLEPGESGKQRDEERLQDVHQVHPAHGLSTGTPQVGTQGCSHRHRPTQMPCACWNNELQSWPSPVPPLQLIELKSARGIHTRTNTQCWCFQQLALASHPRSWPRSTACPSCWHWHVRFAVPSSCWSSDSLPCSPARPAQSSPACTNQHLLSGNNTHTHGELKCPLMRRWDKLYSSN